MSRGTETEPDEMANLHHHDTLDPEVRYLPQPRRRSSVLAQAGWGLWDMLLRLVEFSVKMVGAALLVAVLLVAVAVWGWHHVVEAGVDKLQQQTTTTTAP